MKKKQGPKFTFPGGSIKTGPCYQTGMGASSNWLVAFILSYFGIHVYGIQGNREKDVILIDIIALSLHHLQGPSGAHQVKKPVEFKGELHPALLFYRFCQGIVLGRVAGLPKARQAHAGPHQGITAESERAGRPFLFPDHFQGFQGVIRARYLQQVHPCGQLLHIDKTQGQGLGGKDQVSPGIAQRHLAAIF
jgi:hypothetical protein